MVGARPRALPSNSKASPETLLLKIRLQGKHLDDVHPGLNAHRAQNIRDISHRKLAARSCTLRQALLIQNALPHLDAEEAMRARADDCDVEVEQPGSDEEDDEFVMPIAPNDDDTTDLGYDSFASTMPDLQGFPLSCEDLLDDDEDGSDRGAVGHDSVSDHHGFDTSCFDEEVAVDVRVIDSDDSLDKRSTVIQHRVYTRAEESPKRSRKRLHGNSERDDALKCMKPVRSASPCRLTHRHVSNHENPLPNFIQC